MITRTIGIREYLFCDICGTGVEVGLYDPEYPLCTDDHAMSYVNNNGWTVWMGLEEKKGLFRTKTLPIVKCYCRKCSTDRSVFTAAIGDST